MNQIAAELLSSSATNGRAVAPPTIVTISMPYDLLDESELARRFPRAQTVRARMDS